MRSHFVSSTDSTRRVRSALRLVERIDWDEMCSPLEAVVHEQELILEHRPSCNMYGVRPEMYAYIKANRTGPGLVLTASSRAPKWLNAEGQKPSPRQVVIGPFRGRARLNAALDLLLRCYPVRRCPRHGTDHPCVRGVHGRCLAPCLGEADTQARHDALVMDLIGWLTGNPGPELPDPLEQADIAIKALSRQRRFEEAKTLQEAREHLLNVRRAYENLADARDLRFATLWPQAANGDGPAVRLNLVWNGELRDAADPHPLTAESQIEEALQRLWREDGPDGAGGDRHDRLIADRRTPAPTRLVPRRAQVVLRRGEGAQVTHSGGRRGRRAAGGVHEPARRRGVRDAVARAGPREGPAGVAAPC